MAKFTAQESTSNKFTQLDNHMAELGYQLTQVSKTSRLFENDNTAGSQAKPVLVDTTLYQHKPTEYHYVEYTSMQNALMHKHQGILRFLYDDHTVFTNELTIFLNDTDDPEQIRIYGQQRDEHHLDPTPPEHNFAVIYERVFGGKAIHALKAEDSYIDRNGSRRFIDFTLKRSSSPIAIELNGESYHHPLITGQKQYRSQLFKQNSLVSDGYLVFRWSNRGMEDHTKIEDQLRTYFGCASNFLSAPHFRAERSISSFDLYQHQEESLQRINKEREAGKNTFLVVLPTGTGKTEVFIEDMRQQFAEDNIQRVLVIVPTTALKDQFVERLNHQLPELRVGFSLDSSVTDIVVQTSAYVLRHFVHQPKDSFDYILVDEAHRAAAHGLRKVLEHFSPKTLIGLTATDERLDKQKLEDIFGSYEVDLTLEQAIAKGLVPPIRAFRLSSNIDLSKVRFNGKDFVKSDLNKTVQVPSRDQLIVDVLLKYFNAPLQTEKPISQGIIFCVDVKHTKRIADLLNSQGISAASVHGKDRKGIEQYQNREIRFLCACELLNEGWDAPQTEVVVMARPTMSKVLYTQQLGRGTRKFAGKEALYVIDVVDSYGAALQPWSLHSLFNLNTYCPFENVIHPEQHLPENELIVLDGLWEGERRIEPINIFNFEQEYGDLINEEQLARELFVSTGTVKSWLKKGDISSDKSLPFGRATLHYFEPEQIEKIRQLKGLKVRTEESRYQDFFEFLEQRDYTFSYKIVFLLSLLKHCNDQGEANIAQVTQSYQAFYKKLLTRFGKAEKAGNPLNDVNKLDDEKYLQRSMLQNPFEKFERKRFVYQCKDLALVSFDTVLWEKLTSDDLNKIRSQYIDDGITYFEKFDVQLVNSDFDDLMPRESITANDNVITFEPVTLEDATELTEIPFFPNIKIACGHFKTGFADVVETIELGIEYGKLDPKRHFVACASGNSMNGGKNPILDGDYLLLEWITPTSAGSITNNIMAIERLDETGDGQYLLRVIKKDPNGRYRLKANNPDYDDITETEGLNTFARLKSIIRD
ncbi:DEAD/DEAH box helicase family protein [Thalassotalea sp. LPB0316]|uniref:DEAD/DEAH box helicase family protein n=1 Tax=Thalassotalea sp. LPB0316 TaxID=2769490 RepID=UPI0018681A43|nr:DEAD/DEAH box helicase family protein [Thalassotalea sp. LPB0316]QOL26239.1 DEAD/DEAH box helicase family protein [Thalassotalea sp. LPB0316]